MKHLAGSPALAAVLHEKTSCSRADRHACRVAPAADRLGPQQVGQSKRQLQMHTARARDEWSTTAAMPTRRLATILCADVVGYSRLMQDDDNRTLETLKRYRTSIGEICFVHHGRIVNTPGDSVLVEFSSAVEAFAAAIEIQDSIEDSNSRLESHRRMHFRIGLDLGDILVDSDGSVYGTGVNIAARMQALAGYGGIVMSGKVFDEVSSHFQRRFHALGRRRVKNIRDRVRAYELRSPVLATVFHCNEAPGPVAILRGLLIASAHYLFASSGPLGALRCALVPARIIYRTGQMP